MSHVRAAQYSRSSRAHGKVLLLGKTQHEPFTESAEKHEQNICAIIARAFIFAHVKKRIQPTPPRAANDMYPYAEASSDCAMLANDPPKLYLASQT